MREQLEKQIGRKLLSLQETMLYHIACNLYDINDNLKNQNQKIEKQNQLIDDLTRVIKNNF